MTTEPKSQNNLGQALNLITLATIAGLVAIVVWPGHARTAPKDPASLYNVRAANPIAVRGYDVVEYHRSNKAVKGRAELSFKHEGITYLFSSEDNLKNFEMHPRAYMPAHGGWCSSAMAFGRKVDIDPESFLVENGRLFLFYKGIRGDAKKDWLANQPKWLKDADAQWEKLSGEKPA